MAQLSDAKRVLIQQVREALRQVELDSYGHSDRSLVICTASCADAVLGILLQACCPQEDEITATGTGKRFPGFGNRVSLAYNLGVIDECLLGNLRRLVEIRNVFAHSTFADNLADPSIQKLTETVSLPDTSSVLDVRSAHRQAFYAFARCLLENLYMRLIHYLHRPKQSNRAFNSIDFSNWEASLETPLCEIPVATIEEANTYARFGMTTVGDIVGLKTLALLDIDDHLIDMRDRIEVWLVGLSNIEA